MDRVKKTISMAILLIGAGAVLLQMVAARYSFQTFNEEKVMHLCVGLVLVSLVVMKQALDQKKSLIPIVLWSIPILISIVVLLYIKGNYVDLIQKGDPEMPDMVIGGLLIVLCFFYAKKFFGYPIVTIAFVFVLYTTFGHLLPGPLNTGPYDLPYIISKYAMGFEGILGFILGVSVKYVFLFVVFGSLLMATGAPRFLLHIAVSLSRHIRSGPVLSAIVPSMMMGTITGVPSANIFITGSFSIPLMKKVGLSPVQAGAFEVAASTGGQIMPPVMGAAAFLMADFTNSSYAKIALISLIPAVLFYLSLVLYGHLTVMKLGIRVSEKDIESVGFTGSLATAPVFIVPLGVITAVLLLDFTASAAIFWGICTLILVSFFRKETRLSFGKYLEALSDGAVAGFRISILLSIVGIVISSVVLTGLGVKLSYFAAGLMGNNVIGQLLLIMLSCIVLGMEVPTSAAYILVSFIAAPILIESGVKLHAAHFFVFYFAVFSVVTPPVAPAAAYGAALAKGSYFKTGIESSKLCLAGFLVPFLCVFFPPVMLDFSGHSISHIILGFLSSILIILNFQICLAGYYIIRCNALFRGLGLAAAILFLGYLVGHSPLMWVSGAAVFLFMTIFQARVLFAMQKPNVGVSID
jgi:TRAP transporter 4TM/12TM fusion protein